MIFFFNSSVLFWNNENYIIYTLECYYKIRNHKPFQALYIDKFRYLSVKLTYDRQNRLTKIYFVIQFLWQYDFEPKFIDAKNLKTVDNKKKIFCAVQWTTEHIFSKINWLIVSKWHSIFMLAKCIKPTNIWSI